MFHIPKFLENDYQNLFPTKKKKLEKDSNKWMIPGKLNELIKFNDE